ncbi:MAG TPA: hypothetical protein PLV57_22420 [Phycisphaerae bacterium]|nr:hypothetical protein [Phycisphaerae bacterium]HOM53800.1 hypothetical protein [Phycisphaerae bacterium]HPP29268.1 hypothetical protein [Phycisphaerae bacterium]
MGVTVDLSLAERWEPVESGGDSLEVLLKPMTYLEKMQAADLAGKSLVAATKFECERTVRQWRGVADENEQPIPYSLDNLNKLMAAKPELGKAIMNAIYDLNGRQRMQPRPVCCPECGATFAPSMEDAARPPSATTTAPG